MLRNSLLPTIAVVATQGGYLIGGLVVVEIDLQLPGHRLHAATRPRSRRTIPLLQSGVLVVGIVYLVATLLADIAYSVLNPRIRLGGES